MAEICGKLKSGQDNACPENIVKGYVQEIVLVNLDDVKERGISSICDGTDTEHRAGVVLDVGTQGYRFTGAKLGNQIRGWSSKSVDDSGYPIYTHHVQIILLGVNEEQKCILKNLDFGLYAGFLKLKSYPDAVATEIQEAVEIFGLKNGMGTADYDYDITESNGVIVIELFSSEGNEEPAPPYMYVSETIGNEVTDFDDEFSQIA